MYERWVSKQSDAWLWNQNTKYQDQNCQKNQIPNTKSNVKLDCETKTCICAQSSSELPAPLEPPPPPPRPSSSTWEFLIVIWKDRSRICLGTIAKEAFFQRSSQYWPQFHTGEEGYMPGGGGSCTLRNKTQLQNKNLISILLMTFATWGRRWRGRGRSRWSWWRRWATSAAGRPSSGSAGLSPCRWKWFW